MPACPVSADLVASTEAALLALVEWGPPADKENLPPYPLHKGGGAAGDAPLAWAMHAELEARWGRAAQEFSLVAAARRPPRC